MAQGVRFDFKVDISKAKAKGRTGMRLPQAVEYQMVRFGGLAVKKLQQATQGAPLKTRSGHLRRNIHAQVERRVMATALHVGTRKVRYAKVQDEGSGYLPGGVIKPKRKQYLTIPLGKTKGRAANFPNAFVYQAKTGAKNLFIVQGRKTAGGKSKLRFLFLLKKQVKIPATRWFSGTVDDLRPTLRRYLAPKTLWQIASRGGV